MFLALLILAGTTTPMAAEGAQPAKETKAGIFGRVYSQDGKTSQLVPGATIEVLDQAGKTVGTATSDQRGNYAITLKAGTYSYRISAPGYQDENSGRGFELRITEGDAVYNFNLKKGTTDPNAKKPDLPKVAVGSLIGQVYERTAAGKLLGVSGAKVVLLKVGSTKVFELKTRAPIAGQNSGFELGSMEAGEWQVTIAPLTGFNPVDPVRVTVGADDQRDQDFILTRPPEPKDPIDPPSPNIPLNPAGFVDGGGTGVGGMAGLRGVITLADATPGYAPPIRVFVYRPESKPSPNPIKLTAQGTYQVVRPPGRYFVYAEADGYQSKRSDISDVLAGRLTVVNLRLERQPAELLVKVYCGESKKSLGYALVLKRQPGEPLNKADKQYTDTAGQCLFKPVAPGEYQILAGMDGFKPEGKTIQIRAGESNKLELYLTPDTTPTTLIVYVYGENSKLSGATVKVTPTGHAVLEGVTESNGVSQIKLDKPVQCTLIVSKPGYILQQRQVALVAGDNTQTFNLLQEPSLEPKLTLLVTSAKSQLPLAGVDVRFQPALAKAPSLKTDALGAWNGTLPAPGRYIIELTMKGFQPWKEEVVVSAGSTTKRVPLVPLVDPSLKTGRLIVYVIQAGDQAVIPGAHVVVKPANTGSTSKFDGYTDSKGYVTSSPLAPAPYALSVEKDGFETKTINIHLPSGDHPGTIALTKKTSSPIPIPPVPSKVARLSLVILNTDSKAPIAGVEIKVKHNGKVVSSGSSNEKGAYTCDLPGPGLCTVSLTKPDFEPNQTSVDVTLKETTQTIYLKPITLTKRTINVLVRDGDGKETVPIEGAVVKIHNNKQEVVKTGLTNGVGRFRAEDMPAGIYTIEASKAGFIQRERPTSDITKDHVQTQVPLFRSGATIEIAKPIVKNAAIAYSPSTGKTGVASGKLSMDEAKKAAIKDCNTKDAEVISWSDAGDWCALALGNNYYGCGDGGKTAKQAKENTLARAAQLRITNPRIVVCVNSDGEKENLTQQQDVPKLLQQGRAAIAAKNWTAAATAINSAAKLAPTDANVLRAVEEYTKAVEAAQRQQADQAKKDQAKQEELAKQTEVQKLLQQGRAAIAAKNWTTAHDAIEKATKIAFTDGDVQRAVKEYNQAKEADQRQQAAQVAKQKEDQAKQQEVQKLLQQGRAAIAAKNWGVAYTAIIENATKLAPTDTDVLRARQEYSQAYAKYKEEQGKQQEVQKLVQQGRTAIAAKNFGAAYTALESAYKLAPTDADVLRARQEYSQAYGKQKEEQAQQQQALQQLVQQGRAAIAAKNWQVAANALNSASKLAPTNADVQQAVQEYNQAYASWTADQAKQQGEQKRIQQSAAHNNKALEYLRQKNYDLCIEECNKALQLANNNYDAWNNRGAAYSWKENYRGIL